MLSLHQVQLIVSQCIRRMTSNSQTYSRTKTFARMGIISQERFNGFVDNVYHNPAIGLPFYHHTLPINAFDNLGPDSTIAEAEDILLTATQLPGVIRNPVF